jgi:hypothetical protein
MGNHFPGVHGVSPAKRFIISICLYLDPKLFVNAGAGNRLHRRAHTVNGAELERLSRENKGVQENTRFGLILDKTGQSIYAKQSDP